MLDPHVGGGTTLVEAIANGREAIGIDISSLAEFVAAVKSTVYSERELDRLDWWSHKVSSSIDIHRPSVRLTDYEAQGYYKHIGHRSRWRLRKAIEQSIESAKKLGTARMEMFGRCAVLRTGQLALAGRSKLTTIDDFRRLLERQAVSMVEGARELRKSVKRHGRQSVRVLHRSAIGIETEKRLQERAPRLVITSPPYPGVHVLYHRWQVDGRKEAPLPFMIANKLDGAGLSYYTMGDRKHPGLVPYFSNVKGSMSSVAAVSNADTVIVQMVAFSSPDWQLPLYIDAMEDAGLSELFLPALKDHADGRLWRTVPGRRWYSAQRGATPGSREVVLFHRKAAVDRAYGQAGRVALDFIDGLRLRPHRS